jgi:hypothetical protein
MATYEEAITAVTEGVEGEPQYAYRNAWANPVEYIGLNGSTIYVYPQDEQYEASQADKEATDWSYNGDLPPR